MVLNHDVISQVLQTRDTALEKRQLSSNKKNYDVKKDKELYLLSEASMSLQDTLSYNL